MSESPKESEPDFVCKLNLDLRVKKHRPSLPWIVGLIALISSPFFWRLIEKLTQVVG